MVDDDGRMDELLELAKPPWTVQVAAALLALEGTLLVVTGLQSLLVLTTEGAWITVPVAQVVCGAGSVAAAFGMGKLWGPAGWAALVLSLASAVVAALWTIGSTLLGILSPLVHLTAVLGGVTFLLVAASMLQFVRCVRARRELAAALDGDVPSQGRVAPVVALVVVGLLVFAGLLLMNRQSPGRPTAILVQVRGEIDADTDARVAQAMARELTDFGFVAEATGEALAADEPIEAVRRAASDANAAHAVVLDLEAVVERDGVIPGTKLFSVTCTAHYLPSGADAPATSIPMEFAYEGTSARDIEGRVDHAWVEGLAPWVIEQVYTSEVFQPVLLADVDLEEMQTALDLAGWEDAVWARRDTAQGYLDYCELETERLTVLAEGEPNPVQCLGDPCGQNTLVGVDASGRAIAQESSRVPFFGIPMAVTSSWSEPPERMFSLDAQAPDADHTLFRSGNFYDFGAVTANGRFASVETFGHDHTEAIVLLKLADGAVHGTILLEPRERTRYQLPAPDGSGVVAWLDDGRCLLLSPGERVELPHLRNARWVELADGPRLVAHLDDGALVLFDAAGEQLPGSAKLKGSLLAAVAAGPDEVLVLARDGDECRQEWLAVPALSRTDRQSLPMCLRSPQLLPDGRLVGIAEVTTAGDVPGDPEVVVYTPGLAEPTQLTTGRFTEETVYPTHDGTRVFFNRRLENPPREYDVNLYRRVVCWTDLPR